MRIGRLKVSKDSLDDNESELLEVFGLLKLFPLRCEYMYHTNTFDIIGISPLFDDKPNEIEPSEYKVFINRDENDVISINVKKVVD